MAEPVPQHIQEVIQATVDRAIATLLETGLLKERKSNKGRRNRSRSRSPRKIKKSKDKKKFKKRCSSSSSSSSESSDDEANKEKLIKSKSKDGGDKLDCPEKRTKHRSHSRGRRSRSGSRFRGHHHKRRHHHSGSPTSHHHFHHYLDNGDPEGSSFRKEGHSKGRKRGHKFHCMKFYYKTDPTTSDDNEKDNERRGESELRENFQNLEVDDKHSSHQQVL